jgi:molybdopterin synthase catalytic subunit
LFASFREAAGRREVEVELGGEPRVSDLVSALGREYPQLGPALQNAMVAVNLEYVGPDFRLRSDDEVALIPPVSGGAGARRREIGDRR